MWREWNIQCLTVHSRTIATLVIGHIVSARWIIFSKYVTHERDPMIKTHDTIWLVCIAFYQAIIVLVSEPTVDPRSWGRPSVN